MRTPRALTIWAFITFYAIAKIDQCASKAHPRQIGTSDPTTFLLQCTETNGCGNAAFLPSISPVCLIRDQASGQGTSGVRIYLNSCTNAAGFYLDMSANIVPASLVNLAGTDSSNTLFTDINCGTICDRVELVTYTLGTNNAMLVANGSQLSISNSIDCAKALYVYPDLKSVGACLPDVPPPGARGPPGSTGSTVPTQPPRKKCPSQTQQRVLLTITDKVSAFAVGAPQRFVDGSYRLPIVEKRNGERFYIQEYLSRAVGATGKLETVTAYTLQHGRSRKYLVADVLNDTRLNYAGPNSTALDLMDASEFSAGYAREPDYRFFIKYNVNTPLVNGTVFCPLFHRNYCIYPSVSGYLRLAPLNSTLTSVEPTFVNPTNEMLSLFLLNSRPANDSNVWYFTTSVV